MSLTGSLWVSAPVSLSRSVSRGGDKVCSRSSGLCSTGGRGGGQDRRLLSQQTSLPQHLLCLWPVPGAPRLSFRSTGWEELFVFSGSATEHAQ